MALAFLLFFGQQDFFEDVDGDIVPGSRSGRDTGPGLAWGSWGEVREGSCLGVVWIIAQSSRSPSPYFLRCAVRIGVGHSLACEEMGLFFRVIIGQSQLAICRAGEVLLLEVMQVLPGLALDGSSRMEKLKHDAFARSGESASPISQTACQWRSDRGQPPRSL
jgi:hypothetical protein